MTDIKWLTLNNRLQQGVSLINAVNTKRFALLLNHLISASSEEVFTETELEKLQETLKLSEAKLQLLIQSIAYILKQSSKVILKPTELQKQLVELVGFDQEKAEIFTKKWSEKVKKELGEFNDRTQLNDMKWELNLQIGSDMGSKQALPGARIQLDLAKVNDEGQGEKAILELGEEELQQFYNNLEVIQLKLDNLSKTV
ncbi:hypothetical protein ABEB36_010087 [Hypothenemus hampei]|uniref:COMM domain-containing protein n=1 Tax=Hypothenemus hampei TaxID=57062 RepID=A0ABD1ELF7_HYPHA